MDLMEKDLNTMDVGSRLRELRTERGLSMRALGRQSGLSTNALSMIERGKTSPSVSTLYKIATALDIPITAFFRVESSKSEIVFVKANERRKVTFSRGTWEGLGGESFIGDLEPFLLTLEPGANSGRFGMTHTGHELVVCLTGELEYEVEGKRFILEAGDSLIFAANLSHRWRNPGKEPTKAIITLTCFEIGEHPSEYHMQSPDTEEDVVGE
jgi:transcriptional regulator with XRE-family HTH domain